MEEKDILLRIVQAKIMFQRSIVQHLSKDEACAILFGNEEKKVQHWYEKLYQREEKRKNSLKKLLIPISSDGEQTNPNELIKNFRSPHQPPRNQQEVSDQTEVSSAQRNDALATKKEDISPESDTKQEISSAVDTLQEQENDLLEKPKTKDAQEAATVAAIAEEQPENPLQLHTDEPGLEHAGGIPLLVPTVIQRRPTKKIRASRGKKKPPMIEEDTAATNIEEKQNQIENESVATDLAATIAEERDTIFSMDEIPILANESIPSFIPSQDSAMSLISDTAHDTVKCP